MKSKEGDIITCYYEMSYYVVCASGSPIKPSEGLNIMRARTIDTCDTLVTDIFREDEQ